MKLIYCPNCYDIVKCQKTDRTCQCGQSGGRYLDDLNAIYWGKAIPLGLANSSFVRALRNQPDEGMGERFEAFVIPKICPTFNEEYVMTEAEAKSLANTVNPNRPRIKPKLLPKR
jgi:hypothetical protein